MALSLKKLSKEDKIKIAFSILLLLICLCLVGALIFIKADTLANFSVNEGYFLQDEMEEEVDELPTRIRFSSTSKRANQYDWKIFKLDEANADTAVADLASFEETFDQLGKYGVQLSATGKGGSDVKLKILTLKISKKLQTNLIAQFEQVFKKTLEEGYSMSTVSYTHLTLPTILLV